MPKTYFNIRQTITVIKTMMPKIRRNRFSPFILVGSHLSISLYTTTANNPFIAPVQKVFIILFFL